MLGRRAIISSIVAYDIRTYDILCHLVGFAWLIITHWTSDWRLTSCFIVTPWLDANEFLPYIMLRLIIHMLIIVMLIMLIMIITVIILLLILHTGIPRADWRYIIWLDTFYPHDLQVTRPSLPLSLSSLSLSLFSLSLSLFSVPLALSPSLSPSLSRYDHELHACWCMRLFWVSSPKVDTLLFATELLRVGECWDDKLITCTRARPGTQGRQSGGSPKVDNVDIVLLLGLI